MLLEELLTGLLLQVLLLILDLPVIMQIMVVEYTLVENQTKVQLKTVYSRTTRLNIMVVLLTVMHPRCI